MVFSLRGGAFRAAKTAVPCAAHSGDAKPSNKFDNRASRPTFHLRSAGVVAQLVEHHNGIVGVRGSNPLGSTSLKYFSPRHI